MPLIRERLQWLRVNGRVLPGVMQQQIEVLYRMSQFTDTFPEGVAHFVVDA